MWSTLGVFLHFQENTRMTFDVLMICLVGIIAVNVLLYVIIRTGLNKRFKDPSLTFLQIVIATFWAMVVVYYADSFRSLVLLLYLAVFMFGLFRLNVRQFLILSVFAVVNYAAIILLLYKFHPESINAKTDLLYIVILAMVLPWFSLVGGYISSLRKKISKDRSTIDRLTDNIQDVIFILDMNLNYLYVSPSVKILWGYEPEKVMNQAHFDAITPFSSDLAMRTLSEFIELGKLEHKEDLSRILQLEIKRKDGTTVWTETKFSLISDKNQRPFHILGVMRDITERKQVEKRLMDSEEKFRLLAESSSFAIALHRGEHWIYANRAAEEISGYTEEELYRMNFWDFVHPDHKEMVKQSGYNRQQGKALPRAYEFKIITKKGVEKWVSLTGNPIQHEDKPTALVSVMDITERKQAEEEKQKLEELLHRAEKMEALGQLAGGVAHDLNNVLGVLSGYSELLLMEIPEGQKTRKHVEKILQSTERGAAIIQDLLTLARRGIIVSDVINLNHVVSDFLKSPVFEKIKDFHPRVTFRTECQETLLNIRGSSVHLEKTLMNLVSNAAEAITETGEVTIRTENRYLDKAIMGYDEVKEGDYAILTVSDTGMGISDENRKKIFEPFYTTKTMGRSGTGLGLSIVWGTVKDINGYIDVQTKIGEGTIFTLYFPITREETILPQQKAPIEQYMGIGETVLVVDDIAEQREVASGLIKKLGYEVHAVSSGDEAVQYLKGNKADILVLDMIMAPGIDGLETYQRVLEVNPKQKVIIVSGFSETNRVRKAQELGSGAYVKKPYLMETIGRAIRDELNR